MKTVEQLRALVNNPNVVGFSRLIRQSESDQTDAAYTIINGGSHFSDFSKHPFGELKTTEGGKAAGAYQWLPTTWADLKRRYPVDCATFTPWAQDFGFVAKLQDRGALDDVLAGNIREAVGKCRQEWTSLPGAAENAGQYTLDKALVIYAQYGGKLNEIPLGPIPPSAVPTLAVMPPAVKPPKQPRRSERLTDIPAAELAQTVAEFEAGGATVTVTVQANGLHTLLADYGGAQ
jgi:muramidase (phage lysozyme)